MEGDAKIHALCTDSLQMLNSAAELLLGVTGCTKTNLFAQK
jgi:hypothetical protein